MLLIPSWRTFPDMRVTAFMDDTRFWKFYLIPDYVSIRRDEAGNPVFLLVEYAFSDDDREADPKLPKGGGFLVMDVEMTVPEADQKKILDVLQSDVNQMWNQLKAAAAAGGQPVESARISRNHRLSGVEGMAGFDVTASIGTGDVLLGLHPDAPDAPPGDAPPKVVLGAPTWTQGTFRISAPQSAALVANRVAEGPVSLMGNNVAAANMDLTTAGATFMVKTLLDPDGTGATDLTPIQVVYQLKFWARVPPAKVFVKADTRAMYEAARTIFHDYEGRGCDEDVIAHSDIDLREQIFSELVQIKVDTGGVQLKDDVLQQMRASALKMVEERMKATLADKKPAPEKPEDDPTKDFVTKESDVYYLKSESSIDFSHMEWVEELDAIQEWPANPQGTLQTFFAGMSADEVNKYVRRIDLDDAFWKSLGLTVTAFVDWDDPIAFIECELEYRGVDENGIDQLKTEAFTFTEGHTTDTWDPSLIGTEREFTYRWRVGYEGHDPSPWTSWERSSSPNLNLAIGHPGRVALKVLAGNLDFGQVTSSVQVELEYEDPDAGIPKQLTTVALDGSAGDQDFSRWIFTHQDQPVRYRTHYFFKNKQSLVTDWETTFAEQIYVNEPSSVKRLDVQLIPAGDWSVVQQSIVSLHYEDKLADVYADGSCRLTSPDQFLTWSVLLADETRRSFRYQTVTTYKDGSPATTSAWNEAAGDQALPISVKSAPKLAVKVLPKMVDFNVTPIVEVALRYEDKVGKVNAANTMALTSGDEQTWSVPLADDTVRAFRYQITYNQPDADPVVTPEVTTNDDKLVVPRLHTPVVSCLMVPKLVNFVETPIVQVDADYKDPKNGLDLNDTILFTDETPQSFRFAVAEDSPKSYQLTVTYFLANGSVVKREPVTLDDPKIVIPRYVAAS
jgi:hypothetical protein